MTQYNTPRNDHNVTLLLCLLYQIRGPNRPGRRSAIRPPWSVHHEVLSIGPDRNEAIKIRAQNGRMPVMKAGKDVFVRVSEGILEAI